KLDGVDLSQADLTGANIVRSEDSLPPDIRAVLTSHFEWIKTNGKLGQRATLINADLSYIDLAGVNLSGADLRGSILDGAKLSKSLLVMSDLSGTSLKETDLSGATLDGINLASANMTGAILVGTVLGAVDLKDGYGKSTGRRWPANL